MKIRASRFKINNGEEHLESVRKKQKDNTKFLYLLAFAIPTMIMFALFIIKSIYPFGGRSFLYSDMYHQYMPFFTEFLRKIKEGEGLAYSYNVGIGSNFLALYVYYLASPFHWLAFLVPEAYLMEFMSYLVVVKIGLCGLTASYYLRNHFQTKNFAVVMFSCLYALSGFTAAYNWNIMWLDCVILLPLVVLGLERLVKEGRCGLYCVSLALSIFTNYYISIMICIFLVLYFWVLFLTEKRSWKIIGNFALYSLLAGGMASILLIPEVCAILATDFGDMDFPKKLESYFSVLDMLARHCLCVENERGLDHWPNIYCGTVVFLLLPMYVLNQKISIRQRFGKLALMGFMLLGFGTNMLDFIWHGMNYPDSLPARQSFIYIFLVLTMCYEAYQRVREIEEKQILYGYLGAIAFLLFCEKFVDTEHFYVGIEVLTIVFVTIYAVLLYLHRTRNGRQWKLVLAWLAMLAVIVETSVNTYDTSLGTVSRSAYLEQQPDYKAIYEYTQEREDGFYRLEKFTRKTKNDSLLAGYPTASVFSSTLNSQVMEMYKQMGMRHSKVYYGYDGATAFTAALLNVKYMTGENDKYENSLYKLHANSGDIYLYESQYTLPFGYVAPIGFDFAKEFTNNSVQLQNEMVEDLGVQGKLLTQVSSKNVEDDVKFTASKSGIYYARLTASGTGKLDVIGGVMEEQNFKDLKNGSLIYLGQVEAGETITLTNGDDDDATRKIAASVYRLNEDVLRKTLDILSAQHLTDVEYDSTHLSGSLKLNSAGRLILSIPYETGWTVWLNGEEVEPQLFGGSFMAFDLEPGEYDLEMQYVPTGQYAGIVVSVVSIAVFALLMLWKRNAGKNAKSKRITEEVTSDIEIVDLKK